jgi:hypothetical protein
MCRWVVEVRQDKLRSAAVVVVFGVVDIVAIVVTVVVFGREYELRRSRLADVVIIIHFRTPFSFLYSFSSQAVAEEAEVEMEEQPLLRQ